MRAGETEVRGEWAVPDGVTLAEDVDLAASDPARVTPTRRQCCATRKAGGRCSAPAKSDTLVCTAHAGTLDSSAGGLARAARHSEKMEEAENRAIVALAGARSAIRAEVLERAEQL